MTRPDTEAASPHTSEGPFDFLSLAEAVERDFRSYLRSTFHFRDAELRRSFEQALDEDTLSKGPYIEAVPSYVLAESAPKLLERIHGEPLDPAFSAVLEPNRRLYVHQAQAIEKLLSGQDVVVATGTGSGKTEAFIYPILDHLYRQYRRGDRDAGVRALIIYPMNALANDQTDRLRAQDNILREAGSRFTFTFGQYTGDTPEDQSDTRRDATGKQQAASPGELVFRSQMRDTPPDILLTNFSMLEYLLIRPSDCPLFDEGRARHWAFIVLDEAHQYRGAKGIEMALLLRRLKQRLRKGGRQGEIRCIATSATLGGGEGDRRGVATFATDLFGQSFDEADVILPDVRVADVEPNDRLALSDYGELEKQLGQSTITPEDVGRKLSSDQRANQLMKLVRSSPRLLDSLAAECFPDAELAVRKAALSSLIRLLTAARADDGQPLLSSRIHLFLRSLEGAFVTFSPRPVVRLNRLPGPQGESVFELALCRECGEAYLVGRRDRASGKLVEPVRDPSDPDFGVTFFRIVNSETTQRDEDVQGLEKSPDGLTLGVCTVCATLFHHSDGLGSPCQHGTSLSIQPLETSTQRDQAKKCSSCGHRGQDPIAEVVHGTDGPHAVVATTLYQSLDPGHRKVLAFADGRQQAAFFAWYLDSSHRDLLARNLIYEAVQSLSSGEALLSIGDIALALESRMAELGVMSERKSNIERKARAYTDVWREFLSDQRRLSLEGLGLLKWFIQWPASFEPPQVLMELPWSLGRDEALDVVCLLLRTLRDRRVVSLPPDRESKLMWDDLNLNSPQQSVVIGPPQGQRNVIAWDGERTHRVDLLRRLLIARSGEEASTNDIVDCLRSIWNHIRQFDETRDQTEGLLPRVADGYRLNPDWWRASLPTDQLVCDICQRTHTRSSGGICERFGCAGVLVAYQEESSRGDHYRKLAMHPMIGPLRVEEHTAQLSTNQAREFQRDFKHGSIHVLSCSTTFELGVDLGDLDAVFLRNVPPEPFNYAQRVGRAGRRPGRPGFAVTYCSRAAHDLFHFAEPLRILRGSFRPPVLRLANAKIAERHVAATTLASFFRANEERFNRVEGLLANMEDPDLVASFRDFASQNMTELSADVSDILPDELRAEFLSTDGGWLDRISGMESSLARAQAEMADDYRNVVEFESQASADRRYRDAAWAKQRTDTLRRREVIGFLSKKAVIPKYGFPVDVVSLDTSMGSERVEIDLDRDLSIAISEFAPGASVVANKLVWKSRALKKIRDREWDRRSYAACRRHGTFYSWLGERPEMIQCCEQFMEGRQEYIIPEFGFTTGKFKPEEPKRRPRRGHSTRPYVVTSPDSAGEVELPAHLPVVRVSRASPGELVVLSEGPNGAGFRICQDCGAQVDAPKRRQRSGGHKTPLGSKCSGVATIITLGHRFTTDVLRIQFLEPPPTGISTAYGFAWSLGYAMLEGAAFVAGAPTNDLSVTLTYDREAAVPPIVLYDAVPGGAGLVAVMENEAHFIEAVRAAIERVDGACGCGHDESCYGCLRSYVNQFVHGQLQRGPVTVYLRSIVTRLENRVSARA